MIKHRKKPPLTDLEVGSFSDIAFLLIIFFILTTQIVRLTGRTLDIPSGSEATAEQKTEKKQLTVHLTKGDEVSVSEGESSRKISLEELKEELLRQNFMAKPDIDDRFVILEPQADVTYDLYYKVIMMIEEAGGHIALLESDDGKGGES